jgi:hypothetical protein
MKHQPKCDAGVVCDWWLAESAALANLVTFVNLLDVQDVVEPIF